MYIYISYTCISTLSFKAYHGNSSGKSSNHFVQTQEPGRNLWTECWTLPSVMYYSLRLKMVHL